jgi:hypothetical protein
MQEQSVTTAVKVLGYFYYQVNIARSQCKPIAPYLFETITSLSKILDDQQAEFNIPFYSISNKLTEITYSTLRDTKLWLNWLQQMNVEHLGQSDSNIYDAVDGIDRIIIDTMLRPE